MCVHNNRINQCLPLRLHSYPYIFSCLFAIFCSDRILMERVPSANPGFSERQTYARQKQCFCPVVTVCTLYCTCLLAACTSLFAAFMTRGASHPSMSRFLTLKSIYHGCQFMDKYGQLWTNIKSNTNEEACIKGII